MNRVNGGVLVEWVFQYKLPIGIYGTVEFPHTDGVGDGNE